MTQLVDDAVLTCLRAYPGEGEVQHRPQRPVPELVNLLEDECPICGATLSCVGLDGYWQLGCMDGCTHDELVRYLALTDLRVDPWEGMDAWVAMCLAKTPEMWGALLMGIPVVRSSMNQKALRWYEDTGLA